MAGEKLFRAIAIGASAGGLQPLTEICAALPADFSLPLLVVVHIHPQARERKIFSPRLNPEFELQEKEAEDGEYPRPGIVYLAPANYHLLLETDFSLSLNVDEKVNGSRPSIDVLFETAAEALGPGLIGILLSGASQDGAVGLRKIKEAGGQVLIQDPETAASAFMPQAALDRLAGVCDLVAGPGEIAAWLLRHICLPLDQRR